MGRGRPEGEGLRIEMSDALWRPRSAGQRRKKAFSSVVGMHGQVGEGEKMPRAVLGLGTEQKMRDAGLPIFRWGGVYRQDPLKKDTG